VPATITETNVDFNTGAVLADSVKVGGVIPWRPFQSNGNLSLAQWTGALSWTSGSPTGPAVPTGPGIRFTADSVIYVAHVDVRASAGYTFVGTTANTLVWPAGWSGARSAQTSNAAGAAREITATFRAFSRYPAKTVNTAKVSAGSMANTILTATGGLVLPRGLKLATYAAQPTNPWNTALSTTTYAGATSRFLPDSVYKLTVYVEADQPGPLVPWGPGAIAYGFFGMPNDYYLGNANVDGVTHKVKTAWKGGAIFNVADTLVITFPKTESNPGSGNVIIEQPIPGTGNIHAVGDTLLTTIPGAPKAVFDGWWDGVTLAVEVGKPLPPRDTIFKANKTYTLKYHLVADDGHTVFADNRNADFAGKYTAGDSIAVWAGDIDSKKANYTATFKTPATIGTSSYTLGVPHPIAGVAVADRKAIPTALPAAGTLYARLAGYEIEWYKADSTLLADTDVFEAEKAYFARVIMKPLPQYTMYGTATSFVPYYVPTGDINPTYNIAFPSPPAFVESKFHRLNSDTVAYYFYPTANSIKKAYPDNTDTIRGLANAFVAPVAGALPETAVGNAIGKYAATIEWFEGGVALAPGARFEAAKVYTAKLTVNAHTSNFWSLAGVDASSYFVPDAKPGTYTLVSEEPIVISATENKAVVTYEFAQTETLITIKDIELNETDLIFPTSGWSASNNIARPNVGITIPETGAKVLENEEYTASVVRWESKTGSGSYSTVSPSIFRSYGFRASYLHVLLLDITPKAGYTVFGLDAEIGGAVGQWIEYTLGGGQVDNVVTYTETAAVGVPNGHIWAQIFFKAPLPTITTINGFPAAVQASLPATKADLADPGYTITDLKLDGYLSAGGRYVNDTTYVYTIKLDPATGYTAVGLAKDSLRTTVKADSIKHAVNDLSTIELYYTTGGQFARDYEIEIEVPATGDYPATSASTSEVAATDLSWTGVFSGGSTGRFLKGNTYSVSVTLDNATYSFFGVPANAFSVKDYPYAIVGNQADANLAVIQFPTISNALVLTPPKFTWVNDGYSPIAAGEIKIENNTALTYVIDDIVVSGSEFALVPAANADTIKALEVSTAWKIVPSVGLAKGNHTATVTLHYHASGNSAPLQTDGTISLNVYAVGVTTPEAGELSAYGLGGVLTVKGLVAGEPYSIHNAQGVLIYRGVAKSDEATVNAPVKGVYVVTSAGKTLKVINK
jgi:hypothetical protein